MKNLVLLVLTLFVSACATTYQTGSSEQKIKVDSSAEKVSCEKLAPPPDVFKDTGVDLSVAQSTFSKFVMGDIKLKTSPEVISLASKTTVDYRIRKYIECISAEKWNFTREQIIYLELFQTFMSSNPTSDQVLKWSETNPAPGVASGKEKSGELERGNKTTKSIDNAIKPDYKLLKICALIISNHRRPHGFDENMSAELKDNECYKLNLSAPYIMECYSLYVRVNALQKTVDPNPENGARKMASALKDEARKMGCPDFPEVSG